MLMRKPIKERPIVNKQINPKTQLRIHLHLNGNFHQINLPSAIKLRERSKSGAAEREIQLQVD
jgi:hypothetical protein